MQQTSELKIFHREEWKGNIESYTEKSPFVEIHVKTFDDASADMFENRMALAFKNNQPFVIVRVDSPGGSVYALERMLSSVEAAKQAGMIVVTMCPGIAMSCGSILLAMGTLGHRYCSSHATILLHEISAQTGGTLNSMANQVTEFANSNRNLFRMIAKNARLQDEDYYFNIVEFSHKDLFIHPMRALELKIVDHMYLPRLVKKVTIEYSIEASGKDYTPDEIEREIKRIEKNRLVLTEDVLSPLKLHSPAVKTDNSRKSGKNTAFESASGADCASHRLKSSFL